MIATATIVILIALAAAALIAIAALNRSRASAAMPHAPGQGDPAVGGQLFAATCATCHGVDARGMPQQGVALHGSAFLANASDGQLVDFIKTGRPPGDARSLTGRLMPPRGGNRDLSDQDLADLVSYLRMLDPIAVAGR